MCASGMNQGTGRYSLCVCERGSVWWRLLWWSGDWWSGDCWISCSIAWHCMALHDRASTGVSLCELQEWAVGSGSRDTQRDRQRHAERQTDSEMLTCRRREGKCSAGPWGRQRAPTRCVGRCGSSRETRDTGHETRDTGHEAQQGQLATLPVCLAASATTALPACPRGLAALATVDLSAPVCVCECRMSGRDARYLTRLRCGRTRAAGTMPGRMLHRRGVSVQPREQCTAVVRPKEWLHRGIQLIPRRSRRAQWRQPVCVLPDRQAAVLAHISSATGFPHTGQGNTLNVGHLHDDRDV
ncbi:hypothetical protein BC831DRAFT_309637 [Entophlyctis helioformis]|nr:hypothetical protein BC831DRAFT_309637 [Entophlyctis helioformis]